MLNYRMIKKHCYNKYWAGNYGIKSIIAPKAMAYTNKWAAKRYGTNGITFEKK